MKKNKEEYKYISNTVSPLRRLGSFIADLVIFYLLSMFVFSLLTINIIKSFDSYKDSYSAQTLAIDNINDMYIESKLVKYDDGNVVKFEDYIKEDLTYILNNGNDGSHDRFVNFYTIYLDNLTIDGSAPIKSIEWVNLNIYKVNSDSEIRLFDANKNLNEPFSFTTESQNQLLAYINGEVNAQSTKYYQNYVEIINNGDKMADEVLTSSDQYNAFYNVIEKSNDVIAPLLSNGLLITYVLMYGIYFVVIPLTNRSCQTLAKKLLHINVLYIDESYAKKTYIFLRQLIGIILLLFVTPMIGVFSIQIGYMFSLPLFGLKIIKLVVPCFISFAFCIICYVYLLFNKNHQSPVDRILNLVVINNNTALKK